MIVMIKVSAVLGPLPLGSEYVTGTDDSRRAWRMFQRDHPEENAMCWVAQYIGEGD